MPKQPNFVVILIDDLGYGDVGCYGNQSNHTPHIDQLAAQGLRFTDFHSNGATCSPTRAALLTGLYQNRFGQDYEGPLSYESDYDEGLPHRFVTMAEALRTTGYATGMYGKWHLGFRPPHTPLHHGFNDFRGLLSGDGDHHSHLDRSGHKDWWHNDEIQMEEGYSAELITRHSIDFMERHADRPFFLYIAHLAIHFPWQGPQEKAHRVKDTDYWNLSKLGPHGPDSVGPVVAQMVEAVDDSVGRIIAAIRRLRVQRKTLVFFTSDNGGYLHYGGRFHGKISSNGPLRGQKGDLWEGGHRVPAIAWWPGFIQPGQSTDETVLTMDLMPTFLDLAGVLPDSLDSSRALDGISLASLLLHAERLPERPLVWRTGGEFAIRRGPWKLIERREGCELFHLGKDLGEQSNLQDQYPAVVHDLKRAYTRWHDQVVAGNGPSKPE